MGALFADFRLCFLNKSFENGAFVGSFSSGTAFLYGKDIRGFFEGKGFDDCRKGFGTVYEDEDGGGGPNGFSGSGGLAPVLLKGYFCLFWTAGKAPIKVP